jgi:predicted nucleotidyltransferase
MIKVRPLENILDSGLKIAILRVLSSGTDRRLGGSEIARLAGFSVPSTHEALKGLHTARVVTMELFGNQHVYALNLKDRIVQKIILPMFKADADWKRDFKERIIKGLKDAGAMHAIVSLILHGSIQREDAKPGCDLDLAVIVKGAGDLPKVKDVFRGPIASDFKDYFALPVDAYIKTAEEFSTMLKRKSPVTAEVMKSYSVLYGKEPLDI